MDLNTLRDLYVNELRHAYDAERQLADKFTDITKKTTNQRLKTALDDHLRDTKDQITRLEQIFDDLGESPKGVTCEAIKGLLKEGKHLVDTDGDPNAIDAAAIVSVQRIEHLEIATYGSLAEFAKLLNRHNDEKILRQTLDEEKNIDRVLMEIAKDVVNPGAVSPRKKAA